MDWNYTFFHVLAHCAPPELWKNMPEPIRANDLINVRCVKNVLLCPKLWGFISDNILVKGLIYAVTVVWHLYKIQLSDLIWKQLINNYKEKTKTFMKCQREEKTKQKYISYQIVMTKKIKIVWTFVIKFLLLMALAIRMSRYLDGVLKMNFLVALTKWCFFTPTYKKSPNEFALKAGIK